MDVKYVNPFLSSFKNVMPQIGFEKVERGKVSIKEKDLITSGVLTIVGIVGDLKGNIIYSLDTNSAKQIVSKMMMGVEIDEFNEMAQSALSELSNMLTANASIEFSNMNINMNISTPTLMYGENIKTAFNTSKVLCVEILVDNIPIEVIISIN
ncbi:chemotaxis protein CheX [Tissierella praeacuta]|uniref:chemotaxis protein CheX n=1 Tax=Tissierella praeacuta TaxID=43131 RepID=UPI00104EE2A0|nr:chemotaxis protein CheX [Tissierella praeacuta]TCU65803.1 chemotaxis protein CheX [Tissierella praeacuta]